jgi:pimeloyl-ACP methyl ester carboxylesterase
MKHAGKIALIIVIWYGVSTAAADIEVHCHGQGPLVYLIGGGPAFTTWNLQPIQQELGVRYRVCRWDMRGVGDNAGLTLESQVSALSQWLRDMHEVLPQQPVVLWGHSWGALQVLLFAKHHPERVSRLVLSNPVDPGLRSLEYIERKRFNHPGIDTRLELEDMGTPVEELHNLRSKVASYFADAGQGWGYAAGFTRKDTNNVLNVRVWSDYRDTPLTDADVGRLADRISGAIYCRDDVLQPESLNAYRRLLSADKHHVLTGCAHFPWEENPGAYYRILFRLIGAG